MANFLCKNTTCVVFLHILRVCAFFSVKCFYANVFFLLHFYNKQVWGRLKNASIFAQNLPEQPHLLYCVAQFAHCTNTILLNLPRNALCLSAYDLLCILHHLFTFILSLHHEKITIKANVAMFSIPLKF